MNWLVRFASTVALARAADSQKLMVTGPVAAFRAVALQVAVADGVVVDDEDPDEEQAASKVAEPPRARVKVRAVNRRVRMQPLKHHSHPGPVTPEAG